MTKTVKTVALFMLLGTLAVSCQKENIVEPNATEAQACTVLPSTGWSTLRCCMATRNGMPSSHGCWLFRKKDGRSISVI
ncbi:MAG: hypothetical protein IJQ14_09685 [Bacteroidales bacterium]|nr:hypothetical protein [Bacteroidales bacterium]